MKVFMSIKEVKSEIIKMIAEHTDLKIEEIKETSVFNKDIILDSLTFAEMLMDCEDVFGVEIPVEDAGSLSSVGDLINYVESKIAK